MGFLNAMKVASMNFGRVESLDFPASYLTTKGDHLMIAGAQNGDYEFAKSDVKEFKLICVGGSWIKFKITFNNGKSGIITCHVDDPSVQNNGVSMAPIERYFGDLL